MISLIIQAKQRHGIANGDLYFFVQESKVAKRLLALFGLLMSLSNAE